MATIEDAVFSILSTTSGVTALIGSGTAARIYPLVIPQTAALPAMAYQCIDSPKEHAHDGPSHLARTRLQLSCVAASPSAARSLAAAIRQALDGYRGTVSGVRIDGILVDDARDQWLEPVSNEVRPFVSVDAVIWHSET